MMGALAEVTGRQDPGSEIASPLAWVSTKWDLRQVGGLRRLLVEAFGALDLAAQGAGDAGLSSANFSSVCGVIPKASRFPI